MRKASGEPISNSWLTPSESETETRSPSTVTFIRQFFHGEDVCNQPAITLAKQRGRDLELLLGATFERVNAEHDPIIDVAVAVVENIACDGRRGERPVPHASGNLTMSIADELHLATVANQRIGCEVQQIDAVEIVIGIDVVSRLVEKIFRH